MSSRTTFLGKLIGLYCILVALAMFMHKQASIETVTELIHDAPLMFVVGLIGVVAGLAIVLLHNVWSGGALPVIITLMGWATLVKSALFLFLSPAAVADIFLGAYHYVQLFYFYAAICLVLGIYLTYAGVRSTAR